MSPPFVPVVASSLKNREIILPGLIIGLIGLTIGGKMNMAPVSFYLVDQRVQQDIQVVDGFHPDRMALEPQFRAFRESAVAFGRTPAEALLKVGQGPLQHRIVDRSSCDSVV